VVTYENNLAYTYSTTNREIDAGGRLIRRALGQMDQREASYIDTLGWILYRQGDLAGAEAEIRRALRSSVGSADELTELYWHLAQIRAARGDQPSAVWLQIFVHALTTPYSGH